MSSTPVAREELAQQSFWANYASKLQMQEKTKPLRIGEMVEEAKRRNTEFEKRLHSLKTRFREAEEITRACRNEIAELLEVFEREQEALLRLKQALSDQFGKSNKL